MRLTRAIIRNFRSIKEQTIRFDPPCRVLVGINESGKSNILRALNLLDAEVKAMPDDLRDIGPDEDPNADAHVIFVFATEPADRRAVLDNIGSRVVGDLERVRISTSSGHTTLKQLILSWTEWLYMVDVKTAKRSFSRWSTVGQGMKLEGEWCMPVKNASAPIEVRGISRNLNEFLLIRGPDFPDLDEDFITSIDIDTLITAITNEFGNTATLPTVVFWAYDEENLLPGSIPLDTFADDPDTCMPLKHMFRLTGYTDISAAIATAQQKRNGLTNLLNAVSHATTTHITKVWKEFKGLSIELTINGPNIEAAVQDAHNKFDLARRSDGFKRFVSFLLLVSVKAKTKELTNTLYLHDEPDTSLHPSGARYLKDELIRLSDSNYVVYSTHSIFMIDRENIGRHLIVRKKQEVTAIEDVTPSNIKEEEVIYNALGYSIFEQLEERNILFEGWRDKRLFQVRLSRSALADGDKAPLDRKS